MKTSPNVNLYAPAGRGKLYIAEWVNGTPPTWPGSSPTDYPTPADLAANMGSFVAIGNCPSLEVEPMVERRPHYSSMEGLRTKDLNPVVATDYNVNFDCDEMAASNMKRFLMGSYNASTGIMSALQEADKEYAMIFIATNPIGPKIHKYFRRLTLGPSGPLQLIGDEYLVMSFAGEGLSDVANHAASPYFDAKFVTTTTSSTTTTTTATAP